LRGAHRRRPASPAPHGRRRRRRQSHPRHRRRSARLLHRPGDPRRRRISPEKFVTRAIFRPYQILRRVGERMWIRLCFLPALALSLAQAAENRYDKWLRETAVYIIADEEEKAWATLLTDAQRDEFIRTFWLRRDPSPGTPENEFRDEHERRIAFANE